MSNSENTCYDLATLCKLVDVPVAPTPFTYDYRMAVEGHEADEMFSLGYQWADKPHRLVFNLCAYIELSEHLAREKEAKLIKALEWIRDNAFAHSANMASVAGDALEAHYKVPDDASDDVPDDVPDDASDDVPDDVPDDASDDVPTAMQITYHDEPYTGNPDLIVADHHETTGNTKVGYTSFGRPIIMFEIAHYLTVDLESNRRRADIHQYKQSTKWIRA